MTEREKVIKGLECCISKDDRCDECPYMTGKEQIGEMNGEPEYVYGCDRLALTTDALALLKAQEPRVMGVDEVREWIGKQRVDREPICVEVKDNICAWIVSDEYWDMQMDINLSGDLYGKTWRCWTSRPSAAEREVTAWN